MDNKTKAFVYAFLSRCYEKELDLKAIKDLKNSIELLETIGEDSKEWFLSSDDEKILEELNIDFSSTFLLNSQPVETLIEDSKGEILVGLQNPVMQFYFTHGYEIDMNKTQILAPDHISIELGFMQNLNYRGEKKAAFDFLKEHLLRWIPPYLIGVKSLIQTPFYKDLADFTIEFLFSDYEELKEELEVGN
ncbi:TorD/DmsD family molecular chaperone [Nitrosophilus kaiyonis]|uniref:TorD/DmsD family molecular chaperone n=1 Tax=Nitrosophilus kaiyonis TaxID=2930200 RepID=UPI002493AB5A|nr:molecular chaperone TorD family protein [Nitrosophilus kaiyonis]